MRTVKPEITGEEPNILIREPVLKDGLSVHQLVERCPPLDLNSQYAYNLMGGYFAKTCAVAEVDGKIVGFLLGFIPPDKQDRFFVWQVAVDKEHRRGGTAQKLLADQDVAVQVNRRFGLSRGPGGVDPKSHGVR